MSRFAVKNKPFGLGQKTNGGHCKWLDLLLKCNVTNIHKRS